MTEISEVPQIKEAVEVLEPQVVREVLYVNERGRERLLAKPFDPASVKNQEQFGRGVDDAPAMVKIHEQFGERGLGVRVTTTGRYDISVGGERRTVQDSRPNVITTWVGDEHVRLMSPDEASKVDFGGRTALDWATTGGVAPERVVKAANRLFYPASAKDKVAVVDQSPRR